MLRMLQLGSVGRCYPAWDVEIQNPDPDRGLGEIVTKGRNACMGYLWDEGKTAELIDGQVANTNIDGMLILNG